LGSLFYLRKVREVNATLRKKLRLGAKQEQ
jgi:hypothetical protein